MTLGSFREVGVCKKNKVLMRLGSFREVGVCIKQSFDEVGVRVGVV